MDAPITYSIIGLTVLTSLAADKDPARKQSMMMYPYEMSRSKSLLQFITHGFVHGDTNHLLLNMLSLFFFGPVVERVFGVSVYIAFYLSGLVIASIPSYFRHKDDPTYRSLGASGAISAVVFAVILLVPAARIDLFFILPFPAFFLGVAFLVFSYFLSQKKVDNIEHLAHMSGAIYGIVFTMIYLPGSFGALLSQLADFNLFEWYSRELFHR